MSTEAEAKSQLQSSPGLTQAPQSCSSLALPVSCPPLVTLPLLPSLLLPRSGTRVKAGSFEPEAKITLIFLSERARSLFRCLKSRVADERCQNTMSCSRGDTTRWFRQGLWARLGSDPGSTPSELCDLGAVI